MTIVTKRELNVYNDPSLFFPARPCTFNGVPVRCPNQPIKLVQLWYGPETVQLIPKRKCTRSGFWWARTPVETEEISDVWKKRFPEAALETANVEGLHEVVNSRHFCSTLDPPLSVKDFGQCNFPVEDSSEIDTKIDGTEEIQERQPHRPIMSVDVEGTDVGPLVERLT